MKYTSLLILISALTTFSCSEPKKEGNKTIITVPSKQGNVSYDNYTEGEVLFVMDTSLWTKNTGELLRSTFGNVVYGLPQPEPDYKLTRIGGNKFKGILKNFRNIVFIINSKSNSKSDKYLQRLLGRENIDKINASSKGYITQKNVYFPGQNLIYISGKSIETINKTIAKDGIKMKSFIDSRVNEYVYGRLLKAGASKSINNACKDKFKLNVNLPSVFKIAKNSESLLWYRAEGIKLDRSFIISERDYINETQFSDSSIQLWRDSVGYLLKADEDTVFIQTQEYMPLACKIILQKQEYNKYCNGLWKLSDNALGGPFTSRVFLNKA